MKERETEKPSILDKTGKRPVYKSTFNKATHRLLINQGLQKMGRSADGKGASEHPRNRSDSTQVLLRASKDR